MLDLEMGETLVKLARRAIERYLSSGETITPPKEPRDLWEHYGVFVTLEKGGELRGCIGYPEPIMPLVLATIDSAISAATKDTRFDPVSIEEMDEITVEVSVLTPPEEIRGKPIDRPRKIEVGRDGIIAERGFLKGLLLPQVAVEWGWDEEEFLTETCLKANLPPDCWLDENTKFYKFQATIFKEVSPRGKIIRVDLRKGEE